MATKGTIYQDAALTNVAVSYKNTDLIAEQVLPSVQVPKQSGKIYKFGKDAFRLNSDIRAPGSVSNKVTAYSVSSDTYFCDNHALHDVVPNEDIANADAAIAPEISTTENLTDMILLRREYTVSAYLFNATTFSGYTAAKTGADQWSDYVNSDPIGDVDTAIESIRTKTGVKANTVILGAAVYAKLRRHPQMLAIYQYSTKGILDEKQVADALGVERVLVGRATYNSAKEDATESMADVWGKYCLVAYIASKPELRKPSLGYSYKFMTGNQGYEVYREELGPSKGHGVFVEVMNYFDDIVSRADMGYLLSTVIA